MARNGLKDSRSPDGLWVHVYGMMPPQPRELVELVEKIAALLKAADQIARRAGRPWTGARARGAVDP